MTRSARAIAVGKFFGTVTVPKYELVSLVKPWHLDLESAVLLYLHERYGLPVIIDPAEASINAAGQMQVGRLDPAYRYTKSEDSRREAVTYTWREQA